MNHMHTRKALAIAILGLTLAGCGGGGDGGTGSTGGGGSGTGGTGTGGSGGTGGGSGGGTDASQSALAALQGIWQSPEGAASTVSAIALPDGKLWAITSAGGVTRLVKASLSAQTAGFAGDGKSYTLGDNTAIGVASVSATASVVAKTSLSGVLSSSGAEPQAFALAYQPRYDTPAALSDYAGAWKATLGPGVVSWTVGDTGVLKGTSTTGCIYTGQFSTRTEQKAVLDAAVKEDCAGTLVQLGGVAVLSGDKARVTLLLTTTNEGVGVALNLQR